MANKKTVKKTTRKNTNLRLVKNSDLGPQKHKVRKEEKLRFGKGKRTVILSVSLAAFLAALIGGYAYIIHNYKVTTVYVEGNVHYTNEEIMEMVMGGRSGDNSLFLSLKYRDKGIDDIPFIQTMDVSIEASDTIRIIVYEKALA